MYIWFKNCQDGLKTVWTVWELSGQFQICPDMYFFYFKVNFKINWIVLICRERELCGFFYKSRESIMRFFTCCEKCLRALCLENFRVQTAAVWKSFRFWAFFKDTTYMFLIRRGVTFSSGFWPGFGENPPLRHPQRGYDNRQVYKQIYKGNKYWCIQIQR